MPRKDRQIPRPPPASGQNAAVAAQPWRLCRHAPEALGAAVCSSGCCLETKPYITVIGNLQKKDGLSGLWRLNAFAPAEALFFC